MKGAPKAVKKALAETYPERYSGLTDNVFTVAVSSTVKVQVDILSTEMVRFILLV